MHANGTGSSGCQDVSKTISSHGNSTVEFGSSPQEPVQLVFANIETVVKYLSWIILLYVIVNSLMEMGGSSFITLDAMRSQTGLFLLVSDLIISVTS